MDQATTDAVNALIAAQVQPLSGVVDTLRNAVADLDTKSAAMAEGLAELTAHVEELSGADVAAIGGIAKRMTQTIDRTRTLYAAVFGEIALAQADEHDAAA